MKKLIKTKNILHSAIVVCSSIFIVAGIVSAATTIGNNIVTGGTLSVTGTSSLGIISSGTWNGTPIDISDYTNLAVIDNLAFKETGDTIGVAAGYTIPDTTSVANWNTAYSWGNWNGNVKIATDTDLAVTNNLDLNDNIIGVAADYHIPLTASTTQWATAYGWGNHATAGYLLASSTSDLNMNFNDIMAVGDMEVSDNLNVGSYLTVASSTASSTIEIGINGVSAACLKLQDSDLGGWTYCSFLDGSMICSTTPCNGDIIVL